jgi:hypothetical protein
MIHEVGQAVDNLLTEKGGTRFSYTKEFANLFNEESKT